MGLRFPKPQVGSSNLPGGILFDNGLYGMIRRGLIQELLMPKSKSSVNDPPPVASGKPRRRGMIAAGGIIAIGVAAYLIVPSWIRRCAPETIQEVQLLIGRNELAEAEGKLNWLLWAEPQHPSALLALGRIRMSENKRDDAIALFRQIPPKSNHYRESHLQLGLLLLATGQFDAAERELAVHIEKYPEDKDARTELRWIYFNQFRTRDALRLLEDQLRKFPDDLTVLPELLDCEFRDQVPQEMVDYFAKMNRQYPRQVALLRALGICYWRMGDNDQARGLLQQALSIRPEDAETRLVTARLLIEQREYQAARLLLEPQEKGPGTLETAVEIMQRDDRFWSILSLIAEAEKDLPRSLDYLNRALEICPWELEYLTRKASCLRMFSGDPQPQAIQPPDDSSAKHASNAEITDSKKMMEIAANVSTAHRELFHIVELGHYREPTLAHSLRIAELCEILGREMEAQAWRQIVRRLEIIEERRSSP